MLREKINNVKNELAEKQNEVENKREKKQSKKAFKSTQSDIPIKEIYKGMLIIDDGSFNRYVKILEIQPISYSLKTLSEQNNIYASFSRIFNALPTHSQFITLSLASNLEEQLEIIDSEIASENNKECINVGKIYREKLYNLQKDGIQRRFFIAFEYDGKNTNDVSLIYNEMNIIENSVASILASCGNNVISLGENGQEMNTTMAEILYTFYNRNEVIEKPFKARLMKDLNRYYEKEKSNMYLPIKEIIAPENVSYFNSKYIVVNSNIKKNKAGTYYSFLYISSNHFPDSVNPGWLNSLVPLAQGIDTTVYFEKVPTSKLLSKFRRNLTYSEANGATAANNSIMADLSQSAYQAGSYLKDGMLAGQNFFYMAAMITVSGSSPEDVDYKVSSIKSSFKNYGISLKECRYIEEKCFKSSLPYAILDKTIWDKAKQNVLTEGAAAIYPFDDAVLNDPDGIYFGDNIYTKSLAIVDLFDTKKFQNPNVFICGQTGSGKTYALLLMAIRMRLKHIPIYILAPEKENEFRRVCKALGGQFIQIGAGSPNRINIMEIFKKDESSNSYIDGVEENISYLSEKTEALKDFFKLLVTNPNMSTEEEALLDKAIVETYKRKGITEDNDSLIDPNDFLGENFREMPIISDLVAVLKEDEKCQRMATIIGTLCEGSASNFNGQTNVNLNSDFTVIGLEHLSEKMMPLGIYTAMDFCWSKIKEDKTKRKMLFIDEWWKLGYNPVAANYSLKIAKLIRAYGGGMVIATQEMDDILGAADGKFGKGVLSACKSKVILHLDEGPARTVQELIGINDAEVDKIVQSTEKGEALFIANGNNVRIKFVANELEHKLITTDRNDLLKMKIESEKQEQEKNKVDDFENYLIDDNEQSVDLNSFMIDENNK